MVSKASEWKQILTDNPFLNDKNIDIERLHLTLLDIIPEQAHIAELKQIVLDSDQFEVIRQEGFLCCKDKFSSKSKMTNTNSPLGFRKKATNIIYITLTNRNLCRTIL